MKNILKKVMAMTACIVTVGTLQTNAMQQNQALQQLRKQLVRRANSKEITQAEFYACRCVIAMEQENDRNSIERINHRDCTSTQVKDDQKLVAELCKIGSSLKVRNDKYQTYLQAIKRMQRSGLNEKYCELFALVAELQQKHAPQGRKRRQAERANFAAKRAAVAGGPGVASKRARRRGRN